MAVTAIPHRRDIARVRQDVVDGFARHRLLTYASAIAYQLISAIIPFALFALGLAGLLGLKQLWSDHLGPTIASHVSADVWVVINKTVTQVLQHRQTFWVTFGLVLMLWELSGAMRATMEALDDVYAVRRKRSRAERYRTSIGLSAAVGALVLLTFVVIIGGRSVLGGVGSVFIRYAIAAALLTAAVGLTMRFGPATNQSFKWIGAGSVVIVAGWLLTVGGYILYATSIASYGSVFGSLAAAFVLIVAVYLSAAVFLVGVLVDVSVQAASR